MSLLKKATVSFTLKQTKSWSSTLVMNSQQEQMGEIIVTTNNKSVFRE
jgi:hypothetical protein